MLRRLSAASLFVLGIIALFALPADQSARAATYLTNEGPTLPSPASTITQAGVSNDPLPYVRLAGMQVFSTEFRSSIICYVPPGSTMATPINDGDSPIDGFGDGCNENLEDPTAHSGHAGRPYLQNNGTFLRVNGLGSQSCLECHDQASTRAIPFTLGVGGHGGLNSTEIVFASEVQMNNAAAIINLDDRGLSGDPRGYAKFNGRIINPPDTFGDGGVQLVAEEMSNQLQAEKQEAEGPSTLGTPVALVAKGVDFGSITCYESTDGTIVCDTSGIKGVDPDLVVKPFGRKGEFSTVRAFADNAFEFHSGMQPVDLGYGDADGDGVSNELSVAQLSALAVFLTTEDRPFQDTIYPGTPAFYGRQLFSSLGCSQCHIPELDTTTPDLDLTLPDFPLTAGSPAFSQSPTTNSYRTIDLSSIFPPSPDGDGIAVPMYSDLKRHNMGSKLCETATFNDRAPEIPSEGAINGPDASNFNCMFITAKLWGVFDSAPYLHDGRALTLGNAIVMHAGDAASSAIAFEMLSTTDKDNLLAFLATLHNPTHPNSDVVPQQ